VPQTSTSTHVGHDEAIRRFATGATRDADNGKLDYEGFLSPAVLEQYAKFMHKHRIQADGQLRDSDNWQKGIPKAAYMKSAWRHFMTIWKVHRGLPCDDPDGVLYAACALLFNIMGWVHETLKESNV
jgi:hypothetical protein